VGRNNVAGIKSIVSKWDENFLNKGWNTVFFTNHDQSRAISRFGNDSPGYRDASAKMLYTFLLTQRATPYIYNGDEIGMSNIRFKNAGQYNDLQTRNRYNIELKKSKEAAAAYLAMQAELSRDNSRTPMQWKDTGNAGFTTGKPWLPVNPNYVSVNVEQSEKDQNSILNFVRKMLKLRKNKKDVLVYGKYTLLDKDNPGVYAYTRETGGERVLVLLNFTKNQGTFKLDESGNHRMELGDEWINNLQPLTVNGGIISLLPYQACVVKLK
jgi:oligo-1,6-glucosidase